MVLGLTSLDLGFWFRPWSSLYLDLSMSCHGLGLVSIPTLIVEELQ